MTLRAALAEKPSHVRVIQWLAALAPDWGAAQFSLAQPPLHFEQRGLSDPGPNAVA